MLKKKLIQIRKYSGLNRTKFAEKVGCSLQHISQMERGVNPISFKTLQKYAEIFGLKLTVKLELKNQKDEISD
jgi:transcriptional regulator with XRE-family HTH domain